MSQYVNVPQVPSKAPSSVQSPTFSLKPQLLSKAPSPVQRLNSCPKPQVPSKAPSSVQSPTFSLKPQVPSKVSSPVQSPKSSPDVVTFLNSPVYIYCNLGPQITAVLLVYFLGLSGPVLALYLPIMDDDSFPIPI
jgi:hypothetical protein